MKAKDSSGNAYILSNNHVFGCMPITMMGGMEMPDGSYEFLIGVERTAT